MQYQWDYPLYGGIDDAYDTWTYRFRPSETQNGRSNKFTSMPVNLLFHNNATLKKVYDTYRIYSTNSDYWTCGGGSEKYAVFRDAASNPQWVREDDASGIKRAMRQNQCNGNYWHMRLFAKRFDPNPFTTDGRNGYNPIWGYWVFGEAHADINENNEPNDSYGHNEAAEGYVGATARRIWGASAGTSARVGAIPSSNASGLGWSRAGEGGSTSDCQTLQHKYFICADGYLTTVLVP